MGTQQARVNRSKCRAILRELKRRHCDNFRPVGLSVRGAIRKLTVGKARATREWLALSEEK